MLVFIIIVLCLITLLLIGRKSVHQELIIEANPTQVWDVLTDFESIGNWNDILIPKNGILQEGEKITYLFRQDATSESEMAARVKKIIPNELLNQGGGIPGILTFNHSYRLEASGDFTKLIIHEEYRGIAVPFWNPKPVEEAYGRLARALKEEVLRKKNTP